MEGAGVLKEFNRKEFVRERQMKIYNHPSYQNLSNHFLYNPDFEKKDPRQYIYLHSRVGNTLQPVRISKSISIFLEQQILHKMDQVARSLNYMVVPASIFNWQRRAKFKEKYPNFFASSQLYFMLPENDLNQNERYKFIDHLRSLDWHSI